MNLEGFSEQFHPDWTRPYFGVSHFLKLEKSPASVQLTAQFFQSGGVNVKLFCRKSFRDIHVVQIFGTPEEVIPRIIEIGEIWSKPYLPQQ